MVNYLYEGDSADLYCSTFEIGFYHSISAEKTAEIFNEVFERHGRNLPRKPSYVLTRSDPFGRVYTVYVYVEKREDIFILRPQIAEEVLARWDAERSNQKHELFMSSLLV